MTAKSVTIHQVKITLLNVKPPIWRRVLVPSDITLGKLHDVIQVAMGWHDEHMHVFNVHGMSYGDPDHDLGIESEARFRLNQIAPREKIKFRYEYDFGDSWNHDILVEKILPAEPGAKYPVCVTGKRACPPEDCGGLWGYAQLLHDLSNPADPRRDEYMERIGNGFDPEAIDLDDINRRLAAIR